MDIPKQAEESYVTKEKLTETLEAFSDRIVETMCNLLKERQNQQPKKSLNNPTNPKSILNRLKKLFDRLFEEITIAQFGRNLNGEKPSIKIKRIAMKNKEKLAETGINHLNLSEWGMLNFEKPPSKQQLKVMISLCKESSNNHLIRSIDERDKFETAVNDYLYYATEQSSDKYRRITQKPFKRRIFSVKKIGNIIELPPDIHEYMYGFDDIVIER